MTGYKLRTLHANGTLGKNRKSFKQFRNKP